MDIKNSLLLQTSTTNTTACDVSYFLRSHVKSISQYVIRRVLLLLITRRALRLDPLTRLARLMHHLELRTRRVQQTPAVLPAHPLVRNLVLAASKEPIKRSTNRVVARAFSRVTTSKETAVELLPISVLFFRNLVSKGRVGLFDSLATIF